MSNCILAIETATASCSVAVRAQERIYHRQQLGNNIHSKLLLNMINEILDQASIKPSDLSAVAVGQGPGSFTGLRIGIGVAQGLAYGVNCPMIGISSLDALAQQSSNDGVILAAIDARMGEVYYCEYTKDGCLLHRAGELKVSNPEQISLSSEVGEGPYLVGNAWAEYWKKFDPQLLSSANHLSDIVYPDAAALLVLAQQRYLSGEFIAAADFVPEYVRNNVAKKAKSSTD